MVIAWVYFIIKTISVLLFKGHSKTGIPTFIVSIWKQRFLFVEGTILFKMCTFFNRDVASYAIVTSLLLIKLK